MILRTFSKIYGLAGLRVGYGVGPESVISKLGKIRPPFNVSVPAQIAAQAAIFDLDHVEKSVKSNEKEKKVLVDALTEMGISFVPSAGNFVLFEVLPHSGSLIYEQILQRGIITRSVDEYDLLNYLRVTVGTSSENKKLIKILQEVIGKK